MSHLCCIMKDLNKFHFNKREAAHETIYKRFSGLVKGTISGFDRIVPLMSASEVMSFCRARSILNKDYKQWMMAQTAGLIEMLSSIPKMFVDAVLSTSPVGAPEKKNWLTKDRTEKQLSGKISRHLRLLRVHGLIRKIPKQNRYQLTLKGVRLTNIVNAFWAASTEDLMKIAA